MMRLFLSCLIVIVFTNSAVAQQVEDFPVRVNRISEKVRVFRLGDNPLNSNVTVVATKKGLVVIDTHLSDSIGKIFRAAIEKEFGRNDFAYVINTHHHFDHTGGNQVFLEAAVIGHDNCYTGMRNFEADKGNFIVSRNNIIGRWEERVRNLGPDSQEGKWWNEVVIFNKRFVEDLGKGYIVTTPGITFSDRMTLDMGDLTLKLIYLGRAHVDSDIFIYSPEEKIIWTGDTFSRESLYLPLDITSPDVKRWIEVFDIVFSEIPDGNIVIGGHSNLEYENLSATKKYISDLWLEIEKAINDGLDLETMQINLSLKKNFSYLEKYFDLNSDEQVRSHEGNIRKMFRQHQQSTANLLESIISEKGIEKAIEKFKDLKSSNNNQFYFEEREFNSLGYRLLRRAMIKEAIEIFKINVELNPESWNVYDSIAEVYMNDGNKELAVTNYKKSLELNPENNNAAYMLNRIDAEIYDLTNETRESFKYEPGENTGLQGKYLGQTPPGIEPKVFAPGIVSTRGGFEFSCTFATDGKEFYFNRGPHIMVCRWEKDGWTAPEFAPFNTQNLDHEPHITPDGKRLFFGSRRPRPGVKEGEEPYGIHVMERTKNGWSEPKYHGPGMYVTTAKNGNIYLEEMDPQTEQDGIIVSRFIKGKYVEFELLGGGVNTPAPGGHPCIAPDESFIIFDSRRPGGQGVGDFYVCFRKEDGTWSKAINLGDRINTPGGNMCASLSPDGKYIFYHTRKDIYWVDAKIIENLKPDE
ncbi:MBL fold metallo-hydrolase [candidate division KSB1 bacterium]